MNCSAELWFLTTKKLRMKRMKFFVKMTKVGYGLVAKQFQLNFYNNWDEKENQIKRISKSTTSQLLYYGIATDKRKNFANKKNCNENPNYLVMVTCDASLFASPPHNST